MERKTKAAVFAAIVSALVALLSATALVGHPAHLVPVLTLFAGGFGAGRA